MIAHAISDCSEKTCRILWSSIPEAYRSRQCFADFWAAYQSVIPEEQHIVVGKETGELKGFGGTIDDILANNNTDNPAIVTILPSDKGFESQNCGTWTKL